MSGWYYFVSALVAACLGVVTVFVLSACVMWWVERGEVEGKKQKKGI